MKESTLVRMSFSIEEELLSGLEKLMIQSGYENRSEFVRDMIRKQLTRKVCASCDNVNYFCLNFNANSTNNSNWP